MKLKKSYLLIFALVSVFILIFYFKFNYEYSKLSLEMFLPSKINQEISLSSIKGNSYYLKIISEYIQENSVQLRKISPSTVLIEQWELKDDGIYSVFTQEELYETMNTLNMEHTKNELILKSPIKVGTSWVSETGGHYKITSTNYKIKSHAGDFNTIEVTSTRDDMVTKNYFADGLGIIKTVTEISGSTLSDLTIFSLQESSYNPISYRFYYYDRPNEKIVYETHHTLNYGPERLGYYMGKKLKTPVPGLTPSIDNTSSISTIIPIYTQDSICIDFTNNFIDTSVFSAEEEKKILQCVVNTFGYNFAVSKVIITINGNPYSSKYTTVEKNEPFIVDLSIGQFFEN